MARTTAGMVAMVAIMTACAANSSDAAADSEPVVVLHVTNDAHVSRGDLTEAQQQASRVYEAAGVRTIWTDGAAQTAQPDGAFHIDVVLVPYDKTAGNPHGKGAAKAFGKTWQPTRRAYVFYNPIFDHAMRTGSNVARLLAAVIAHEVGHILLPAGSHSPSGIMRANWFGCMLSVPGFTVDQGMTMRRLVTATTAQ